MGRRKIVKSSCTTFEGEILTMGHISNLEMLSDLKRLYESHWYLPGGAAGQLRGHHPAMFPQHQRLPFCP